MKTQFYASTTSCRCSVATGEETHVRTRKGSCRGDEGAIEAYSDLSKRSTARYAEYEVSIKLRDETESQLRTQLQGVTDEVHTSRRVVAEKVDELNQLRVLLREEAELYGDDYERSRNSSVQGQRITELEGSLANVRVSRDLEDTTKNCDIAVKKRQDADSDLLRYSNKLRRQESTLEKQKEEIRVLQEDVDRLRDKYDDAQDRSRDHENDLSTQRDTIVEREGTIQDL
jgi:hypothetical protein